MKIGAKDSRKVLCYVTVLVALMSGAMMQTGCGGAPEPSVSTLQPQVNGGDGIASQFKGYAAFGTQCLSGFNTDPKAIKLELLSCPVNIPVAELAEPLQPLYLSADCRKKNLTIRSLDHTIDSSWELMPDGTFSITQEGLSAKFKSDGNGNTDCISTVSMDLWGQVDCSGATSDKAKIRFETAMHLSKKPVSGANTSSAPQCNMPASCFMHAVSSVSQCN